MRGHDAVSPEEHLRQALLELQAAQRQYIAAFAPRAGDRHVAAEDAARQVDAARAQAQQWAALARAATREDDG